MTLYIHKDNEGMDMKIALLISISGVSLLSSGCSMMDKMNRAYSSHPGGNSSYSSSYNQSGADICREKWANGVNTCFCADQFPELMPSRYNNGYCKHGRNNRYY